MEFARFGSVTWSDPVEVTHDPSDLGRGAWVVVVTFEGDLTAIRFARRDEGSPAPGDSNAWPAVGAWTPSLTETEFVAGVQEIRDRIAAGTVYQVNLTTMLAAELPADARLPDLAARLARGNPAPFAGIVHVPSAGLDLVSASPERYLTREGERLLSSPIKGTAPTMEEMLVKDVAENVMIVDLVRNDLQRVCHPGSVAVDRLCGPETHPGLVHLVSDVAGRLRPGTTWGEVLDATAPAGSVSGAPKSSALQAIGDLEPSPRGPYCGAIGWIDAEHPAGPRGNSRWVSARSSPRRTPTGCADCASGSVRASRGDRIRGGSGWSANSKPAASSDWHLEEWRHEHRSSGVGRRGPGRGGRTVRRST